MFLRLIVVPSLSAATKLGLIFDFVVITTKVLPDIVSSQIKDLQPLITLQRTSLVLIQNGLNIETPFSNAFPGTPIISGVSMIGSRLTTPRTILHEDPDFLKVGAYLHHTEEGLPRDTQLDAARLFASVYNAGLASRPKPDSGAECILVDDIVATRWRKLLWNASFNTICTLLRISVGELIQGPGRHTLLESAMHEIVAIATAAGFGDSVTLRVAKEMLEETPSSSPFRPSMLVDLEKGRPLELEAILGAPLRVAKEKGVATPVLSQVYSLLSVTQWTLMRAVSNRHI